MPVTLRPYQSRTLDLARAVRRTGKRRILIVSPTGSGKSVMACEMIRDATSKGARVLVIGHRKELIDQFFVHLGRVGIVPGIMRGSDERTDTTARVQVGTVQTLVRRDLPEADIVFIDEAHRAPGDSYLRVLESYPGATVFGLTATPCRLDSRPLKEHFDALVESASYSELIDAGAIMAPIVYAPRKVPDVSGVKRTAGDYNEAQLEAVMMQPHVIGDVVQTWLERADGRRTVCFAVGIDHSKELVEEFVSQGVRAAHLDGTTPEDERDRILLDLETGRLQLVSNVGVLCEGWDQPSVKCCIMARPTLSLALWMQCAGRILRPHGSLPPIILDHSGNVDRHGLPHEDRAWSLDGRAERTGKADRYHVCKACYAYVEGNPCPVCGYETPVTHREVRKAAGSLERVGGEPPKDPQRAFFDKQVELSKKRGFAPGYASAKFKEKFGNWPSWAWSQSVKADYARDPEWQARVGSRKKEREFWEENQAARKRALESGGALADQGLPPEVLGPEASPARERVQKRKASLPVDASHEPKEAQVQLPLVSFSPSGRERSVQTLDASVFSEEDL